MRPEVQEYSTTALYALPFRDRSAPMRSRYLAIASRIAIVCCVSASACSQSDLTRTVKQWQPKANHPAIVAFSPDGRRLAVSNVLTKDIRIYSVPNFDLLRTIGKPGEARAIAFAPDSKVLAAGNGFSRLLENRNSVRLWDIEKGEVLWEPPGFIAGTGAENDVEAVAFDSAGKVLLASLNSVHAKRQCCYLFLIDLEKKSAKGFGTSLAYSIAFSPIGDRIVSGGFDGIRMWSASGEGPLWEHSIQRGESPTYPPPVRMVAFSPDGSGLLVSSNGVVTIHNAVDGQQQATLPIKVKTDRTLAVYSPNGRYIVVAASDRLFIFDAQSKSLLEESDLPKPAFSISFASNSRMFAIGTSNGTVVVKEFAGP